MSDQLKTFAQLTFEDIPNAISSLELESGAMHSGEQVSQTITQSGQVHAHANLSARQAKEKGLMTSGTYGLRSTGSFRNAAPERSLANRLRVKTDTLGSTLFRLTWKLNTTPSGRSIFQLRASVRPTSAKGCTGVRSPSASDHESGVMEIRSACAGKYKLRDEAALFSPVPTPMANKNTPQQRDDFTPTLSNTAMLFSSVATPTTTDAKSNQRNPPVPDKMTLCDHGQMFASVATPMAGTPAQNGNNPAGNSDYSRSIVDLYAASGETPNGSSAETESTGQLNPCYSRWLMGIPVEWEFAAFRAFENRKAQKSISRSSKKVTQGQ